MLAPPEAHEVDHPGPMGLYQTMLWPPDIPNSAEGKLQLLRRYRFSICPENNVAPGYVTEKLADVHVAGAVPLYWGDLESFPEVFNPARVLRWDDFDPDPGAALRKRILELESDAVARAAFFAQPVLRPGAQAWVHAQCASAAFKLSTSLAHLVRKNKTDLHAPASGAVYEHEPERHSRTVGGFHLLAGLAGSELSDCERRAQL